MESIRGQYGVMVGIGCGRVIHSKEMPIDTVTYLSAAETVRQREKCEKGALILANIDVQEEIADFREERLRKILNVLEIENRWDLVKQTDISEETRERVVLSEAVPTDDLEYFTREVQDAVVLLRERGVKVGWVLNDQKFTGGEAHFDVEIHQNRPDIRFIYNINPRSKKKPSLIGIPLTNHAGQRKAPYLARKPEVNLRVCLPIDQTQMEAEMNKITKVTPSEFAVNRIIEFCKLANGKDRSADELDERLQAALEPFLR